VKKLFVLVLAILSLFYCHHDRPDHKIKVGMTYTEVEHLLGMPEKKTLDDTSEQWDYGEGTHVNFKNGVVEMVEN